MISLDLIHRPLSEIVASVKSREVSPVALMRFVIDRVQKIHKRFNVVVEDRFQDALNDAKKLEVVIARGEHHHLPLLGLPFSVKANISLNGMRLDMGTWNLHGQRSTTTATSVQRLIDAGAIPVVTTNLSEMGLWHDTVNPLYGRTLNPWNTSRMVGGSSGGEAALIAAGGTLFGLGTDLDGSLRFPGHHCGVFGHKPTRGLIPLTGQFPFFRPEDEIPWRALDSLGPLARHALDLDLLLGVLAGPCSQDPMSMTGHFDKSPPSLENRTVGFIDSPKLRSVVRRSPEVRLAMHKARQRLIDLGVKVVDAPYDLFYDGHSLWRLMLHRAIEGQLARLFGHQRRQSFYDVAKWFVGHSERTLASNLLMLTDHFSIHAEKLRTLDSDLGAVRRRFEMLFTKVEVLVTPVSTSVAPYIAMDYLTPSNLALTGLVNALGLPATAGPIKLTSSGLPVGAQVIGKSGSDRLTIAVAEAIGEFIPAPIARGALAQT